MRAMFAFGVVLLSLSVAPAIRASQAGGTVLTGTQEEQVVTLIALPRPYIIRGDYYVPRGKELVIGAGARFVAEKDAAISVSGTLVINGTREKPVVFRAQGTGRSDWKGIILQQSERAEVRFANVSGAAVAVYVHACEPTLYGCLLSGNTIGVKTWWNGKKSVSIENCTIAENREDGLYLHDTKIAISSCTIRSNKGCGVRALDGEPQIERAVIADNSQGGVCGGGKNAGAHHSVIHKNGKYDVMNEGIDDWDFSGNWWGESATKFLISKGDTANLPNIHDGHDEQGKGKVRLHGFLREMPKDCGAFAGEEREGEGPKAQDADRGRGTPITFTRECYLIANSADYNPFHVALANKDTAEVQRYVDGGRVFSIKSGTKALAVTARGSAYGVRILDGPNKGKEGWVYAKNVKAE